MNTSFSFSAMISNGWATFKKNWKFIILAGLATFIIQAFFQVIQRNLREHILIMLLATIVMILVGMIINVGWIKVTLSLTRTGTASWNTFKTNSTTWVRAIKVWVWYILYFLYYTLIGVVPFLILTLILAIIGRVVGIKSLIIIGGLLAYFAFIVVAVYTTLRYQFAYYVMLDNPELRSKAVFKKAGSITKGNLLQLLGFAIVLGFYNLLGFICLGIGLVVTIPVSKLAHAKVYDFLKNKNHEHANSV